MSEPLEFDLVESKVDRWEGGYRLQCHWTHPELGAVYTCSLLPIAALYNPMLWQDTLALVGARYAARGRDAAKV